MDSKPLDYESLMIMLQYMDANKRFEVSNRIPHTRTADRVAPLFIDKLGFKGYDLTINEVKYTLRTHIKKRISPANPYSEYITDKKGFARDLDEFGLEDVTTEAVVTHGDLVSEKRRGRLTNDEDRQRVSRFLENNLERQLIIAQSDNRLSHQTQIENYQSRLIPYNCHRDNKPLPYEIIIHIRFLRSSSTGAEESEEFCYTKKLPEVMKYLTTKLFGGRTHPISVKILENNDKYETIRLPVNLKLKVRKIKVEEMIEATQMLPVIQNSEFESFRLDSASEVDFESALLKTAKTLTVGCRSLVDWLPIAQNLSNKKVLLLRTTDRDFVIDNYILLIKHWIDNGREVGTCYWFGFKTQYASEVVKNEVMKQFGKFSIAMKNQCKLMVSFEKMSPEMRKEFNIKLWMMKMEVVE